MTKEYDLVVLGGGTGGYVSAIRASQLGMRVAIVEKDKLGGTCLHQGCIPSKALLRSAEVYRQTKLASDFGIDVDHFRLNFSNVQERKNKIIEVLYKGVQSLINKGKIDVYYGFGRILGPSIFSPLPGTISIEHMNEQENTLITPKNILIATGSEPKMLENVSVDGQYIIDSNAALQMDKLPQSIIIVGGGIIGIEWASMLVDFDVEVTVIESLPQVLPNLDETVAREAKRLLKKKGVNFYTNAKLITEKIRKDNGVTIEIEINDEKRTLTADQLLISIGRSANYANIGLENTDIIIKNDFIQVNEFYQTKEPHIYAVGDVIGGMQLAHVAAYEGIIAVEHMADENPFPIKYENIPICIYSNPEIASIGLTEKAAKKAGLEIKVSIFPFRANSKALILGESDGFVKLIINKETDDILGMHMIGPYVTEMISESGLAKVLDATPWEITENIYPHPSLTEVIAEVAMAVEGRPIHI